MEQADLLGHLRIMKEFFLLGRGELFLAFIDQAQNLLSPIPSGTTEHGKKLSLCFSSLPLIT